VLLEAAPRTSPCGCARPIASIPGVASMHRPPRVDRHQRRDRDERSPRGPKPGRQPACARSLQACLGDMGIRHVTVQMERDPTCE